MIYQISKRVFDFTVSVISVLFLLPLYAIIGILVKITSSGPILYRGKRAGQHGKPFYVLKYRTMLENAEQIGGPSTAHNDVRLTTIGKVLRKFKLDELPQFFNILGGSMSLVGPRPQVFFYTDQYTGELKKILTVRPGLTDFASMAFINMDQILGDGEIDEKYQREIEPWKNELRLKYIRDQSFCTDLKILLYTALLLFKIKKEWNGANSSK